ncbi:MULTISPECIES: tyrosine-protein phosphatase [Kandleria]|uniref:Protein-tyrosine phosphatase n=1 Tax=Kandleria vitulina TaxID=1630 RepID=A0A1H2VS93_9FIRM|nr:MULTISPECIES: tyrosine-protein phosphatase [Kandleria]MBP3277123.1 tyrosine-protein phosphatase [Kandleria sp.]SDW71107.1 protein-tyrosine phosphatase [Kandleria vitulina]HAH76042.1 protein-tyrosine-phosphatase [Kandleria vitulina]HBG68289.1 protein-tyrosine-phosphatase [Kandleria vitulina]HCY53848.1 protein-tyrosine-phosphatase [Kandleria vitulina]
MLYMTREERYISLDHMPNTRDLGGYETQDGHYTKAHHFVRASGPYECSDHDLDKLYDYGVRVTIDLRSDFEKKAMASRFSEDDRFENIEINLLDTEVVKVVPEEVKEYKDLGGVYIYALEAHKQQIKEVFDVFLNHLYDCVLFHCSAGKDRTGIISALLLDLAGCHDYDIVKDYSESYSNNMEIIEQLEENMDEATRAYLNSSPRYMMIMMDFLREHYGSAYSYLLDIGLTEDEINDIKDSFII